MKNAIIIHGIDDTPDSFWLPSIKEFLIKKGYSVWSPQMPNASNPGLKEWKSFILDKGVFNNETIIIGHSIGASLILSLLENISTPIHKAILVAGYAHAKHKKKNPVLISQDNYDWKKIKSNVKKIIFINSNNDPWGFDHDEGLYMWKNVGGTLILREGEGHMGSNQHNQPYKKFPLLEKLLS